MSSRDTFQGSGIKEEKVVIIIIIAVNSYARTSIYVWEQTLQSSDKLKMCCSVFNAPFHVQTPKALLEKSYCLLFPWQLDSSVCVIRSQSQVVQDAVQNSRLSTGHTPSSWRLKLKLDDHRWRMRILVVQIWKSKIIWWCSKYILIYFFFSRTLRVSYFFLFLKKKIVIKLLSDILTVVLYLIIYRRGQTTYSMCFLMCI